MAKCVIGIGGPYASGKSTLGMMIAKTYPGKITLVNLDHKYFHTLDKLPNWPLAIGVVESLKNGFDYQEFKAAPIVLVEGICALHSPQLLRMMTYKVFIECDSDISLARIIRTLKNQYSISDILDLYESNLKGITDNYANPTKKNADFTFNNGSGKNITNNPVVIAFCQVIGSKL